MRSQVVGVLLVVAMATAFVVLANREPERASYRRPVAATTTRCTSCHVESSHPRADIFAPHASKVSCEGCHATEDRRAEDGLIAEQRRKWGADHMIEHPPGVALLPTRKVQASCARCHSVTATIPGADVFNRGLLHYERSGCYACHDTPGMNEIRRPAPPLTWAGAKLDPRWAFNWILHPPAFKPTSRMPPFFPRGQIGWPRALADKHPTFHFPAPRLPPPFAIDTAAEWMAAMIEARRPESMGERVVAACLAEYVLHAAQSKDIPDVPEGLLAEDPEDRLPRVARGRSLVTLIGCTGCHQTDENYGHYFHAAGYGFMTEEFATNLVGTGDKFDTPVGRRWIFHWLKDPKKYFPETRMPNFRLTDEQAADIASYLLTLRVDNTQRATYGMRRWNPVDPPLRIDGDTLAIDPEAAPVLDKLWSTFAPGEALAPRDRVLAFGERLFEFFGCYGCHDAAGARDWTRLPPPDKPVWELIPEKGVMQRMPVIESN